MVRCCKDCGVSKEFNGKQEYKEYGTESLLVDENDEIIDYRDRDSSDNETDNLEVYSCGKCNSENIEWLESEEYDEWKSSYFDEDGNYHKEEIKSSLQPKGSVEETDSLVKLKLLNDQLLKNTITIEQYIQKKQQILEMGI